MEGKEIIVGLVDPEYTKHLLGDSKHTSTLQAEITFSRMPLEHITAEATEDSSKSDSETNEDSESGKPTEN